MKTIESGQFSSWLKNLKDEIARARIVSGVNRLMEGLPGDVSPVGRGLSELRVHIGPGYRVYLHRHADTFVILLYGGDKSSQKRDIATAHRLPDTCRAQHE
jgi:putative addiction module killer protein